MARVPPDVPTTPRAMIRSPANPERPEVDESARIHEAPVELARRLALDKARAIAGRETGDVCVLGSDTLVVLDDDVLGKPRDTDDAGRMLRLLSGRTHQVLTGVAVRRGARCASAVETSVVHFAVLDAGQVAWYVGTGEPADKAGAYGLQGSGGRFVTRVDGSRSNVVGLPLARLERLLAQLGAAAAAAPPR